MSVLPIHLYGQPVLRKKARMLKAVDDDIVRLAQDMLETMHNANGIGLAGNQVGVLHRVIVVDVADAEETQARPEDHPARTPLILINPEIVRQEGTAVMEEGCLSIPEIRDEVERAESVTVRYTDLASETREIEADGLLARVLLHEIDHLNGVLFIDHIGGVKRKLLRGRLNKIQRGEVEIGYPLVADVPAQQDR